MPPWLHLGYFRRHPSCAEPWFAGRHEAPEKLVRASDPPLVYPGA